MRNLLSVGLVIGLGIVVAGCGGHDNPRKRPLGASTATTSSDGTTWLGQGPSHLTPVDGYDSVDGGDGSSVDGGSVDGGDDSSGDDSSVDAGSGDGGSVDGGSTPTVTEVTPPGPTPTEPAVVAPVDPAATLGARPAASLTVARGGHAAIRLRTGEVLVVGGLTGPRQPIGAPELYDPATNLFTPLAPIPGVAAGDEWKAALPTLTLLQDDRVLVTGGYGVETAKDKSPQKLKSAYVYSPLERTFTRVTSMKAARVGAAAALLPNGDVLVTGGGSREIEVYTPATNTWTQLTADAKRAPIGGSATIVGSRLVLAGGGGTSIDGGSAGDGVKVSQSILLEGQVTATTLGKLATGRTNHAAARLDDQHVVVVGGHDPPNPSKVLASIEVLDLATGTWSSPGAMGLPRTGCELARVHGALAVFGGSTGTTEAATIELLQASGATDGRVFPLVNPRNTFSATELLDGRVLLAGGFAGSEGKRDLEDLKGTPLAACELFGLGVGPSGPSALPAAPEAPVVLTAGPGVEPATTTPSHVPAGPTIRPGDLFDAASQLVGFARLVEEQVVGAAADLDRTTGASKKQARISYTFVKDGQVLATKRDATNQASNGKGAVQDDFNAAYGLNGTNGFSLGEGEYPAAVKKAYPEPKGKAKRSYAGLVIVVRAEDFADETVGLELARITR